MERDVNYHKGIGFCIVQALAQRAPEHTYVLGVRSPSSREEAISKLKDLGSTRDLRYFSWTSLTMRESRNPFQKPPKDLADLMVRSLTLCLGF